MNLKLLSEDFKFIMPATDGTDSAIRYRYYPMLKVSYNKHDNSISSARLNEAGFNVLKEISDRYYPFYDPNSKTIGLSAQGNGTVVLHENNKRLAGIGRLLAKMRNDDDINRFIVVKAEQWFKDLHGIDVLLIPFSSNLSQEAKRGDFGAIVSKFHLPEPEEITVPELPLELVIELMKKK